VVLAGLNNWLDEHEYESVAVINGRLSQHNVADSPALARANYTRVLKDYRKK
jgi:dihydroorotate dehydrogenase (fumarate)